MFVAERFIADLVKNHGKHPISTEMVEHGILKRVVLKINHDLHSSYEKSIIERTMQYIKDRYKDLMTIFRVEKRNAS
jgi:putative transposase